MSDMEENQSSEGLYDDEWNSVLSDEDISLCSESFSLEKELAFEELMFLNIF